MSDPKRPHIVFFHVRKSQEKLQKIAEIAKEHFIKREKLLIIASDQKALEFVDDLLWRIPKTSFLPHVIADAPTEDPIVLTKRRENLNQARFLFNLCPTPLLFEDPFKKIYEFEDLSTQTKEILSKRRFAAYRQAGYHIEGY